MSTLLRRVVATAAATVLGVSLLIAAKSGPGGSPVALRQPGVIGRPPAGPVPRLPVATAPPLPETTTSPTAPATSSSTSVPSTTTAPAAPSTTATTRRPTSSSTATTRPPVRPAPTAAPAPTTRPTPTTAAPASTSTQPTTPPTGPDPTTTTTAASTTTTAPGTTTVDSPVFTASHGNETFGPVQVRLTFQGHRIVDAVALQTPNHAAKSRQINARAAPILRQEVLDAQSAQIDTVSGATATSEAYAQCVQAILDQVWK